MPPAMPELLDTDLLGIETLYESLVTNGLRRLLEDESSAK